MRSKLFFSSLLFFCLISSVLAIPNPSAKFCEESGKEYVTLMEKTVLKKDIVMFLGSL